MENVKEPVCCEPCEAPNPSWLDSREYDRKRDEERDAYYREQNKAERLDFLSLEVLKLGDSTFTPEMKRLAKNWIESRLK